MGAHTLPEDLRKAQDRYGSVDDGNASTFSGIVTFSGANAHTGIETHTGAETHAGNEVFTGDNDFSAGTQTFESGDTAQAGTAAGRGPSPLIWGTCPVLQYMLDPTDGHVYFNDFQGDYALANNQTATDLGDGLMGFTGATGGSTLSMPTDEPNGALKLATTTDNESVGISCLGGGNVAGQFIIASGKEAWFEARIKVKNITNSKFGLFCGFAEEALLAEDGVMADAGTLSDKDYLGFHRLEGDGDKLDTVFNTASGGTSPVTIKADAVTLAAGTYIKVGFYYDGTTVTFYADGVALADTVARTATDFPDGEEMAFYMVLNAAHDDDADAHIDWVRIAREF